MSIRLSAGDLSLDGGIAQLGERLLCKQEVIGSIPFASTILLRAGASQDRASLHFACKYRRAI